MDRKKNISHPQLSPYPSSRSRFYRYTQAICVCICLPVIFILFFSLTLKAETTYKAGDRSITIVPREECERLLTPFLFPEQAIDSGLNKLIELNNLSGAWNKLNTCHDHLKDLYAGISVDKIKLDYPKSNLEKKILSLQIEQYKNFGTPKEKDIQFEIEKLKEELSKQKKTLRIFVPQVFNAEKELQEFLGKRKKKPCIAELSSKSYAFKILKPNSECPDGYESLEEKGDFLNKASSIAVSKDEMKKKFYSIELLSYDADISDQVLDSSGIEDLQKLNCFNPYEKSESRYFSILSGKPECNERWINSQTAADLAERLASKIGNSSELFDKISKIKKNAINEQESARQKLRIILLNIENSKENGAQARSIIRLLSRLLGTIAANKRRIDLESFCLENEATQWRDKKYFELKNPIGDIASGTDGQFEIIKKTGLTEGELAALQSYTSMYYKTINAAIWQKKPDVPLKDTFAIYKEVADSGLERLPEYTLPVRRFTTLPDSILKDHQVGNVVNYAAYTSTSKEIDWRWYGEHAFTIIGHKNGHDISEISTLPGEKEVLFRSDTNFKVISRNQKPNGGIEFILLEVDDKGMPYNAVSPPGKF